MSPAAIERPASRFIHNGHSLIYYASDKRRESIRVRTYRRHGISVDAESDDEDTLQADIEADWALLEAVVRHWDGRVARTLQHT